MPGAAAGSGRHSLSVLIGWLGLKLVSTFNLLVHEHRLARLAAIHRSRGFQPKVSHSTDREQERCGDETPERQDEQQNYDAVEGKLINEHRPDYSDSSRGSAPLFPVQTLSAPMAEGAGKWRALPRFH
jgi:hypothetical protein